MSDQQTSTTPASAPPAPPPAVEDVGKFSASQAASWIADLGQRVEWVSKLLSGGDLGTLKLFEALVAKRSEGDGVDEAIAGADMQLPEGGANNAGLSPRDVRTGVAALLDDGLSGGSVAELLRNAPVCSPEDYRTLSREFSARCLNNAEWKTRLLAGDPEAKRQLLAMGVIKLTSRPLPESPRFDVVR
jgi:hypothetical protein